MKQTKNIKVYGTLVNNTLDTSVADTQHNDVLMNAYQLYDGRFGDSPAPNNFQDIINKRVTAIQYADGVTTIQNRSGVADGIPYMFVVNGKSNLNGDTTITGNAHVTNNLSVGGNSEIAGSEHIYHDLQVDGNSNLKNTTVTGTLTVNGPVNTTGEITIGTMKVKETLELLWNNPSSTIDSIVEIVTALQQNGGDIAALIADLNALKQRVAALEDLWEIIDVSGTGDGLRAKHNRSVTGYKFFDATIN